MEQEQMAARRGKLCVLLGTNGTGKTTLLRRILEHSGQRCLVVTPDDAEWTDYPMTELQTSSDFMFDGIARHIFDPDKVSGTLSRLEYFKKGIIVFDDCRAYLNASTDKIIHQLLIRRRQREVDIFAVGHGFNEVPPVFFTFSSEMILFKTTDNIARRRNCLKEYEMCVKAQSHVNKRAESAPHYYYILRWQ